LTKPLIVTETVRGRAENAVKITYGLGTSPFGASIKAYRPEGRRLEEVGRLTVEDRNGRVAVACRGVGVEVDGEPVCKAD
jgi:hypothetical protein